MVLRLVDRSASISGNGIDAETKTYLTETAWRDLDAAALPGLYRGVEPVISLASLGRATRGMGFLTLAPDGDGVFRRLPLLVEYEDAVYPSFALKAVCEFLKIPPSNVVIGKRSIRLIGASDPDRPGTRDLKIPVDRNGSMRINFVGPWGRMKHYHFSDIYFAEQGQDDWPLWQEEMKNKIVLISNTYTGSTDVGRIPVDSAYPLSGVHANVVHTILNEDFIWDINGYRSLLIQILIVAMLFVLFLRYPSIPFSVSALVLAAVYFAAAVAALVFLNVLPPVAKPLLLLLIAWSGLFSLKSIQNAFERMRIQKAKEIAERELAIGRKIQADFLPSERPAIPGWQIETRFKPAYQVSGDFYDVFELSGGKYHAIVIGDVCDHGVGSALFMAVVRSMVRIFSLQSSNSPETSPEKLILETVNRTNDYIAANHGDTGMFATMFIGFLDSTSGDLFYVNCGHEPPPLIRNGEIKQFLKATGLAVGVMEGSAYTCRRVTLKRNDFIFLYTDGIIDALDKEGKAFSKDRLLKIVSGNSDGFSNMLVRLQNRFLDHVSGGKVTDDVTYMAIKNGDD
jgi:serine phosphatase RsbU (regulator of sigma subunit)